MARTHQPLEVRGQRLTGRDGLRDTIAELYQVKKRDEPEPHHNTGQVLVGLLHEPGRVIQQRRHLPEDASDTRTILRSGNCDSVRFQHRCGDPAHRPKPPSAGQPLTDHLRH